MQDFQQDKGKMCKSPRLAFNTQYMDIFEDTRNKIDKHSIKHKWFQAHNCILYRSKLPFGDYTALGNVYIDTKQNMAEIAGNIGGSTKEHERFRRELILAQTFNKRLYILVENTDGITRLSQVQYWDNPRLKDNPKAITGIRLCKAMDTMQERYGCRFVFCSPEKAGLTIAALLERDY